MKKTTETAMIICGFNRENDVEREIPLTSIELGIAKIRCLECGGSGRWRYGPTRKQNGPCVTCKGTGQIYINC